MAFDNTFDNYLIYYRYSNDDYMCVLGLVAIATVHVRAPRAHLYDVIGLSLSIFANLIYILITVYCVNNNSKLFYSSLPEMFFNPS